MYRPYITIKTPYLIINVPWELTTDLYLKIWHRKCASNVVVNPKFGHKVLRISKYIHIDITDNGQIASGGHLQCASIVMWSLTLSTFWANDHFFSIGANSDATQCSHVLFKTIYAIGNYGFLLPYLTHSFSNLSHPLKQLYNRIFINKISKYTQFFTIPKCAE